MCNVCLSYTCRPGCPNETPNIKRSIGRCEYCGNPIMEGDGYADLYKGLFCSECLQDIMSAGDILNACGVVIQEARL